MRWARGPSPSAPRSRFGATRWKSAGGFEAIADQLADDYRLGELTRRLGLRTVLSPVIVDHDVVEEDPRSPPRARASLAAHDQIAPAGGFRLFLRHLQPASRPARISSRPGSFCRQGGSVRDFHRAAFAASHPANARENAAVFGNRLGRAARLPESHSLVRELYELARPLGRTMVLSGKGRRALRNRDRGLPAYMRIGC